MLKIRLQRVGRKHETSFRVVLVDSRRAPKSGAFLEVLGSYDPRRNGPIQLKNDRITHRIAQGAKVSGTVHNILVDQKIIRGPKRNVSPTQKQKGESKPVIIDKNASSVIGPIEKNKTAAPEEARSTQEAAPDVAPAQPAEPTESPTAPQETKTALQEDTPETKE